MSVLENSVREDLNERAPRAMAVLKPLKVVILNYPEGQTEQLPAANHPRIGRNLDRETYLLAAKSTLSGMISWKTRRASFFACGPMAKSGYVMHTS
jgi:glutamyl/glutaminyl-tRNA synthetase